MYRLISCLARLICGFLLPASRQRGEVSSARVPCRTRSVQVDTHARRLLCCCIAQHRVEPTSRAFFSVGSVDEPWSMIPRVHLIRETTQTRASSVHELVVTSILVCMHVCILSFVIPNRYAIYPTVRTGYSGVLKLQTFPQEPSFLHSKPSNATPLRK